MKKLTIAERLDKMKLGFFGSESGTTLLLKEQHNEEIDDLKKEIETLVEQVREEERERIKKLNLDLNLRIAT